MLYNDFQTISKRTANPSTPNPTNQCHCISKNTQKRSLRRQQAICCEGGKQAAALQPGRRKPVAEATRWQCQKMEDRENLSPGAGRERRIAVNVGVQPGSGSYLQSQYSGGRVSWLLFSSLKQLKEGGIYFGFGFQSMAPHGREQEWEVTVTLSPQGSTRQKDAGLSSLLLSTHSRTPAHSMLLPTLTICFPTSINLI